MKKHLIAGSLIGFSVFAPQIAGADNIINRTPLLERPVTMLDFGMLRLEMALNGFITNMNKEYTINYQTRYIPSENSIKISGLSMTAILPQYTEEICSNVFYNIKTNLINFDEKTAKNISYTTSVFANFFINTGDTEIFVSDDLKNEIKELHHNTNINIKFTILNDKENMILCNGSLLKNDLDFSVVNIKDAFPALKKFLENKY